MATIVEMINPLTGLPEQVDKLDHTAQEIDDAVTRAFKVSTRNFLRNWYFVNPVNQRGVSGTISTTGYFIDGWKLVSGTVQITSAGLVLNGTIEQILESGIGQPVKATFLASDGVFDASYSDSTKKFTITATGKTLIAAKLELGSQQTLAHQDADGNRVLNEIPDYGEQMRRCQRYQRKYASVFSCGTVDGSNILWLPLEGLDNMRTTPSITDMNFVWLACDGTELPFPSDVRAYGNAIGISNGANYPAYKTVGAYFTCFADANL